jgi:hypothetical protein
MRRAQCWTGYILLGVWGLLGAEAAPRQNLSAAETPPPAIEARIVLDTGWQFPLISVREPVIYRLQIDHHPQVQLLPASFTPEALRRALVRSTSLPPELFQITEAAKHTEQLAGERLRETVDLTLRFSKPGIYSIPALSVSYSSEKSRQPPQTFQSLPPQGFVLTVDAHMPAGTGALPGNILTPPRLVQQPWSWLRYLAVGMLASGVLACAAGVFQRTPRSQRPPRRKLLSPRQLRTKYQAEWQHLRHRSPTTPGPLSANARTWFRDCAALVRHLLGDWSSGDPMSFAGGAGNSPAMITAYLQVTTPEQEAVLQPCLDLLHELDVLATAPAPILTADDYRHFSEAVEHTILQLTQHEAARVFRVSPRL